jgi:hypothetical protein
MTSRTSRELDVERSQCIMRLSSRSCRQQRVDNEIFVVECAAFRPNAAPDVSKLSGKIRIRVSMDLTSRFHDDDKAIDGIDSETGQAFPPYRISCRQ